MKAEIKKHIETMRPELLAYANYKASERGCELSGSEILDQAISSVLAMPEDQLNELYSTPTRAGYNKLDFRIAKRIKFYCKVLGRKETVSTVHYD
jgi:hypothetical protein